MFYFNSSTVNCNQGPWTLRSSDIMWYSNIDWFDTNSFPFSVAFLEFSPHTWDPTKLLPTESPFSRIIDQDPNHQKAKTSKIFEKKSNTP